MKLTIARHGETNYNVLVLHNADPSVNVHLTEKGIQEAKTLGTTLQHENFDAVFVSELPRTQETARYVLESIKTTPPQIIIDRRLNDINTGFEGKSVADYHKLRDASDDIYTFRYKNFESSEDVFRRTADFLNFLRQQPYQNVLIVTSKHNFRHLRSLLDHLDPRASLHEHIPNGELLVHEL